MHRKVSIIILNFNGKQQLSQNLPSILENLNGSEILVVDNGSIDKSIDYLKSSFPQVKIVALDKNYGFCKGLNEGAKAASHDLLLFLNNDVQVSKDFLSPLIKHFDDPEIFGVSPKVIRPLQDNINESIITGDFAGGVINAKFAETQKLDLPNLPLEVFSVCGAAFMVDKNKFFEIGGLDEMLQPFYYEETDLSYRALKRGWKIIYEPKSLVYHWHDQTIGKQFPKSLALWSYRKNQYLAVWKNIDDPWLLSKHILQMILVKLLIPNLTEWRALFSALRQLPEVMNKRIKQKAQYQLSDRQVFKYAAKQKKIIELKSRIKRILIIRPDAIGDLVLTLPAIHAIKENFPEAKITALVKEYTAPLLKYNTDIDNLIHDYDFKKHKFDLSVNFFNEFKDTYATYKARIPYRLGDSSRVLISWMNNLRVFRRWNDFTRHEVEFNFDLLEPLGIKAPTDKVRLKIDPEAARKIERLLMQENITPDDLLVGMHIGAGGTHNKSWNTVDFAAVTNWLIEEKKAKVVLTGEGDAADRAAQIDLLCKIKPLNLVGKLSLNELIALTSKYKFYIGSDTGPTHIAAALGIPMVAIFLSKRAKPLRWGPWKTRHVVVKNFSQCEKVCDPPLCRENIICPNEIKAEQVIKAAEEVLNGGGMENDLYHWLKNSLSITLINNSKREKDIRRAEFLFKLLKSSGYNVQIVSSLNPRHLIKIFIKQDTSIIHEIDRKGFFSVLLAWLLTGIYQSNRALLIRDQGEDFADAMHLVDFYISKFKKALL